MEHFGASNRKVKLAFGGVFASLNAPLVKLQCPEVDFVCRGDGEQLILDLLLHLNDPEGVPGLTWMKDGRVIQNPGRPMERHLDQWPFPDRESLKLDFVESMPLQGTEKPVPERQTKGGSSETRKPQAAGSIPVAGSNTFLVFLFPADGSSKVVTIEVVVVQGRLKWKRTNTPQVTPLLRWDRIVPRRHTY